MQIVFSNEISDMVVAENSVNDTIALEYLHILQSCTTLSDYLSRSNAPKEYAQLLHGLPTRGLKILDIGVGRGESSLYLANCGHIVYAVEPSPGFCTLIEAAANKFSLDLTVCQGVAEDLKNLRENSFDIILFNASLHHCDNSKQALQNSFDKLSPNGYIFLVSELFIKPWRSKKRFYELMKTNPIEMGNYGGNEHAYYSWEYRSLLKQSSFVSITSKPMAVDFLPLDRIQGMLSMRINGERVFNEKRVFVRVLYYYILSKIVQNKILFTFLSKASIVAANYKAQKPA